MVLSTIENSGSVVDVNVDITVEENGDDLLMFCPGGCKKKILFFGFSDKDTDWGSQVMDMMCIDCRIKSLTKTTTGA